MKKVSSVLIDENIALWNKMNPDKEPKTRASVAKAIGVNYQSLSRLSSGKIGKGMQTLSSLAQELETSVDSLLKLEQ